MIYGLIVKSRIRQSFDHVNNHRWDDLMNSIAPTVHHRFPWRACDRWGTSRPGHAAAMVRTPRSRPSQPSSQDQQHLGERLAMEHHRVRAMRIGTATLLNGAP